jgi:hypothetical protein
MVACARLCLRSHAAADAPVEIRSATDTRAAFGAHQQRVLPRPRGATRHVKREVKATVEARPGGEA